MQHPSKTSALVVSGLNGKSVTGVNVGYSGSMVMMEIVHSTGSTLIKEFQGRVEVGGTEAWGTGTEVQFPLPSS